MKKLILTLCMLVLMLAVHPTQAQPGGVGGGGGVNFRDRMMTAIQDSLALGDDEWKIVQPRLDKVMSLQQSARGGSGMAALMGGGAGGRTGGGGGGGGGGVGGGAAGLAAGLPQTAEQAALTKAAAELRTALDNPDTSSNEMAGRLAAYREARDRVRAELEAAQKEMKDLLTQRQQAVLVSMGLLE